MTSERLRRLLLTETRLAHANGEAFPLAALDYAHVLGLTDSLAMIARELRYLAGRGFITERSLPGTTDVIMVTGITAAGVDEDERVTAGASAGDAAIRRYRAKCDARRAKLPRELALMRSSKLGEERGFEPRYASDLKAAAVAEIAARASDAGQCLKDALAGGWSPDGVELDEALSACIGPEAGLSRDDISAIAADANEATGHNNWAIKELVPRFEGIANEAWDVAVREQLEALRMEAYKARQALPLAGIHIHDAGIVQVGDRNAASIVQNYGTDVADLVAALVALRENSDGQPAVQALSDAAIRHIEDGDRAKAWSVLDKLPAVIELTYAVIGPGYEMVRMAAAAMGHPLPDLPKVT